MDIMKKIVIINGPNLNLLGRREPQIYGTETWEDTFKGLCIQFPEIYLDDFQSNHEGDIIDHIQKSGFDKEMAGIVINPGALAHYSYAVADAIAAVPAPVVEVHISNIMAREEHRRRSVTAASCLAMIAGAGRAGYSLAIQLLLNR